MGTHRLAIVCCVQDEAEALPPFLAYHAALGVSRAYVFLDGGEDRTREVLRAYPWVVVERAPESDRPHRFEYVQWACALRALELARAEGIEWLLHIDPDEFAWGGALDFEGAAVAAGDLLALLDQVRPATEAVVLRTLEAVPRVRPSGTPFWAVHDFVAGAALERDVFDLSSGLVHRLRRCIGHELGKSIVRTSAHIEPATPHRWTRWHGQFPAPIVPLVEEDRGVHFHYVVQDADQWRRKYRRFRHQPDVWARGVAQQFPKLGWKRSAASMSEREAAAYYAAWVAVPEALLEVARADGRIRACPQVQRVLDEIGFIPASAG